MNFFVSAFAFVLFVVLAPGTFIRFPKTGGKWTVAIVHAFVFTVVFSLLVKPILRYSQTGHFEGFDAATTPDKGKPAKPAATTNEKSGK